MNGREPEKLDAIELSREINSDWDNSVIASVNDQVVRLSVLNRDFHWHTHERSDELFYVIEGRLMVDFEGRSEEIKPGQMIKVPKGMLHRTRADERTILLCFESEDNDVLGD